MKQPRCLAAHQLHIASVFTELSHGCARRSFRWNTGALVPPNNDFQHGRNVKEVQLDNASQRTRNAPNGEPRSTLGCFQASRFAAVARARS